MMTRPLGRSRRKGETTLAETSSVRRRRLTAVAQTPDAEEAGAPQTFADSYDKIAANVKAEAAKKAYKAWIERLRAETYVKVY